MPDFSTWSNKNLAAFATDAHIKMIEQEEHIETLKANVRYALEAYRAALREQASTSLVNNQSLLARNAVRRV
jgi:hypothetical protein